MIIIHCLEEKTEEMRREEKCQGGAKSQIKKQEVKTRT